MAPIPPAPPAPPPPSGELVKAKITNLDTNTVVTCMFNPVEYTFSKTNKWCKTTAKGYDVPRLEFGGGDRGKLKLKLLFDTLEPHGKTSAGGDVRTITAPLWDMMNINIKHKNAATGKGEPPSVRFEWGKLWSFTAVITSISETFTLFRKDGTPVRAKLDVEFEQLVAPRYPKQNPTSGGNPGEHLRTVTEGETLSGIAFEEYGNATVWRHLADTNGISDPRRLQPGQVLLITPLPQ